MAKAKVKLDLRSLTIQELIQKVRSVAATSVDNDLVTGSPVSLVQLTAAASQLEGKAQEWENNRLAGLVLTTEQTTVRTNLEGLFTQFGGHVETRANGNETLIRSTGLDVRAPSTAVGTLAQPANLSVTLGDFDGELDLDWDNVRGANSYQIQRSPDPISATSWTLIDSVTASKATVKNLTSGTKYWFRVSAIGAAGPGPWSNPVAKIAP